jgi:NADPH-dependent curcumin reductase CurA
MMTYVAQIARPAGRPSGAEFALATAPTPEPADGEALVANEYLSVDPYMREVMDTGPLGVPMQGRAIGRVIATRRADLAVGDLVLHRGGWRTHAVVGAARTIGAYPDLPLTVHLGILGGTGLSAYVGLAKIAQVRPGDTVYISAAAGAVGGAAGQIARLLGAGRIIGSTGSAAKARHLTDRLGYDAAINYRDGDLPGQLAAAAPDGIDVYLDNVGGDHLDAALGAMREHGRIAWCGGISWYDNGPTGLRNLYEIVGRQLRLEGFLVRHHLHLQAEYEEFLVPHLRSGAVVADETITDGLANAPSAFVSMLAGQNLGKAIIRV